MGRRTGALWTVAGASGIGVLAVFNPTAVLVILVSLAVIAAVVQIMLPRRFTYSPWRVTLPPLLVYTALSLLLQRPAGLMTQVEWAILYSLAFAVGGLLMHALFAERVESSPGTGMPLKIRATVLRWAQILGVSLYAYVYHATGVPVLSGAAGETRVELASPGLAGVWIIGRALVQIAFIFDLLSFGTSVDILGKRARRITTLVGGLVLLSSSGRNDILNPLIIAGLIVLLSGWRRVAWAGAALIGGVSAFLTIGALRSAQQASSALGPAYAYLVGTAQINDRIARTFPTLIPYEHGRIFFWFMQRLSGQSAEPPGIFLRDLADRTGTFVGFGLETNVLGAFYLDWGLVGIAIGGVILGCSSYLVYLGWRRRGGWWAVSYAVVLTLLLVSIANHPIASYWTLLFPTCLFLFWAMNRYSTRRAEERECAERQPDEIRRGRHALQTRTLRL